MSLLAMDRRSVILERVQSLSSVRVAELAAEFNVTEETIRRDLEKLEAEGYLTRTYGGAVLVQNASADLSINVRETQNPEGKRRIARVVSQMIEDGATIMADSSTTSLFAVRNMKDQKLTVITNSVRLPQDLAAYPNIRMIITGGLLRPEIMSLVGPAAESTLSRYYADYAVIGCKTLDVEEGMTFEPHERESVIKQLMSRNARKVILVADHTKFGKKSVIRTLGLEQVDLLVTDEPLDEKTESMLKKKKIEIVYA